MSKKVINITREDIKEMVAKCASALLKEEVYRTSYAAYDDRCSSWYCYAHNFQQNLYYLTDSLELAKELCEGTNFIINEYYFFDWEIKSVSFDDFNRKFCKGELLQDVEDEEEQAFWMPRTRIYDMSIRKALREDINCFTLGTPDNKSTAICFIDDDMHMEERKIGPKITSKPRCNYQMSVQYGPNGEVFFLAKDSVFTAANLEVIQATKDICDYKELAKTNTFNKRELYSAVDKNKPIYICRYLIGGREYIGKGIFKTLLQKMFEKFGNDKQYILYFHRYVATKGDTENEVGKLEKVVSKYGFKYVCNDDFIIFFVKK